MDAGKFIGVNAGQEQSGQPEDLKSVLLRMTPEERQAMFAPYQDELSIANQTAQPQQHTTTGGALFGGLANMFGSQDRSATLGAMQADAAARAGARYGVPMNQDAAARQALADALRRGQAQMPGASQYSAADPAVSSYQLGE